MNRTLPNTLRKSIITLSLVLPAAAHAASFNCSKAITPQEKAICNNPELSHADEQLAAAYKASLQEVSLPAQIDLRTDQAAWLKWLSTVCRAQNLRPSADLSNCMIGPYRERTEILEKAVIREGSILFYTRSLDLSSPDDLNQEDIPGGEFKGIGTLHVEWPQASTSDPAWKAWNTAVQTAVYQFAGDGKNKTLTADMAKDADTNVVATVQNLTASRIATSISFDTMGHGAAHPSEVSKTFYWLLKQNRAMLASDVFRTGTSWKQALARRCWDSLTTQFPDGEMLIKSPRDKSLIDVVDDIGNWTITKTGLQIDFPEYSVTPRVAPAEPVTIPWSTLKPYLVSTFDPAS
jgi:uncharacterized protein